MNDATQDEDQEIEEPQEHVDPPQEKNPHKRKPAVDVFVTSECIHLYILCLVLRCLFQEVSIMYLNHVMPRCSYREIL